MNVQIKLWRAVVGVLSALTLAGLACGGGGAPTAAPPTNTKAPVATVAPTQAPKPTSAPVAAGEIAVLNTFGYTDAFDYFHVVGEVQNNTEKPLSNIELTLQVKDAQGNSLLRDSDDAAVDSLTFSPWLFSLAPGETSPFDYSLSTEAGQPDTFDVTVTGQQTGEKTTRAALQVENAQMIASGDDLFITGELVNHSTADVQINSYAAAALDPDDLVVASSGFGPLTRLLAPAGDEGGNDRTPFRFRLDSPGEAASQWAVYWDADEVETPQTFDLALDTLNHYVDTFGSFHVVGLVTNNSDQTLSIGLVAGLYGADGTVLDADTLSVPLYLAPGESLPYDFQYFSHVNSNAAQADQIDTSTVQVDPYWTYPTSFEVVSLQTANDHIADQGDGQFTFTADVTNDSDQPLSSLSVVVALYDPQDNLVATAWGSVFPDGDTIPKGETHPVEISLYLDPDLDTQGFTFSTWVQGYVK